ncbi:zinc-dependent metalloprotease [Piscinibacter defluvii]|uniref:zinc-dependent metalloprotease n=1 Tax=Piscinibacter defluvii TaxID=1796922 RepID=UPI000FDF4243|nr:zinc-dependent metalloprotease [Piscinibacter defluvii]
MSTSSFLPRPFPLGPIGLAAVLLSGCASVKPPGAMAAAPASAAAPAAAQAAAPAGAASGAAAARPEPGAPKPFDEVVKGATRQDGFFPVWRKDEKTWLEIPAERLGQPFLLSANIASSVGERGLYAGSMGPSWLATFRQVNRQLQLVALNAEFVARNPAMKATVAQSFSDSLLASAALASAEHPQRKSLLVDASFLIVDLPAYSTQIEAAYRLPYGLDRANSSIETVRVTPDLTTLNLRMHFATPRIPVPPLTPPPVPLPAPPATLPDARSLFAGFVYNFAALPEPPMRPREADPRLGHFTDVVTDLSDDLKVNPRTYRVNRWRLEKADPAAALSEPKQPIVFWLDRNIPPVYRQAVEEGVLEWNKAFEKIGFRNAIVAKQQPDDADWDTLDARHASIRWFTGADAGFARGPSQTDPRSGEIVDADIMMSDVFGRGARRVRVETVGALGGAAPAFATPIALPWSKAGGAQCDYAEAAAHEMGFAVDLLEARGELAPDSPEVEAFAQAVVRDTIMHEVGHALGLKHNFKASTVYTRAQLQDAEFTAKNGIAGSVMDYSPYNLALAGEKRGALVNTTIGPYDYWAIEYAYKPLEPGQEKDELQRIAARSSEPLLAYADDTDAGGYGGGEGLDPLVNRFDLGSDPLEYYRRRLALSRELWQRVQERQPQPGEDVTRQRRVLLSGFSALGVSTALVGKYVGGMQTSRDLPGASGGRPAYQPVPPAKQREALRFLADGLFAVDAFRFKPQFLASLSPDYREWTRGGPVSIPAAVLQLQTGALDRLLSPGTATRLLELPLYLPENERRGIISLDEVIGTLQKAVWSELRRGGDIEPMRRNLQREHLKRVQALLTRSAGPLPADAVSLVRLAATGLQAELQRAAARPGLAVETRAHLQDSLVLLTEALRASFVRG